MTRCSQGHFYDPAKHPGCPWCSNAAGTPAEGPNTAPIGGAPSPAAYSAPVTQRLIQEELGIDPVVGWLVCVEGPERGRDYRIRSEKNFIGRAPMMDICIAGDSTISRDKHATLVFEPKKQQFWLMPGESSGLVYLNGDIVHSATEMNPNDMLELGKSRFVLVTFVNDKFRWE